MIPPEKSLLAAMVFVFKKEKERFFTIEYTIRFEEQEIIPKYTQL